MPRGCAELKIRSSLWLCDSVVAFAGKVGSSARTAPTGIIIGDISIE